MGGLGLGIAYDNELGARMWAGGVLRDPVTRTFELTGLTTFGGLRRDVQAAARRRIYLPTRPSFMAGIFAGQQQIPFFAPEGLPTFRPRLSEATGTLGFEWAPGTSWLFRLSGQARAWSDTADAGHQTLDGVLLLQRSSVDGEILSTVEVEFGRQFQREALVWHQPINAGRWTFTPGIRAGIIRGTEVPLQLTFPLGGTDGFPGLHLFERRGGNEAMVTAAVSYQLTGPMAIRVELSAGDVRADSADFARPLFQGRDWLLGGRVGLGIKNSPLGPVRLEYGATSVAGDYRDQVFLRVGRWF
jgi:hypothetical protein